MRHSRLSRSTTRWLTRMPRWRMFLHYYDWDWAGAERAYHRAVELNPGSATVHHRLALFLAEQGRSDEAVAEARSAVELDPIAPASQMVLATVFVLARQFDTAIAESKAGIELDPSYHIFCFSLGQGLGGQGKYDDAVEAFRQGTIANPGDLIPQAYLGWALGLAGQKQEALTILEGLERRRGQEYVGGFLLALVS